VQQPKSSYRQEHLEEFIKQFGGLNGLIAARKKLKEKQNDLKSIVASAKGMDALLKMDPKEFQGLVEKACKPKGK
jgi:hypothetical protein